MDPISLAVSSYSVADNFIRPRLLKRLGSESDTSIQVLHSCRSPRVDIVCIPDIHEDPLEDWTSYEGPKQVNWLTDLLPLSFPYARVLLFKYSSRIRTSRGFTRYTIHAQAEQLLRTLWSQRRGLAERRPLLFMVHNEGGLIARSALFQASAALTTGDAHLRSIYLSTGSLFVIHTASERHEHLLRSWQEVIHKAMQKIPSKVAEEPDQEQQTGQWLEWQQNRFRAIAGTMALLTLDVRHELSTKSEMLDKLLGWAKEYEHRGYLGINARIRLSLRKRKNLMQYVDVEGVAYTKVTRCVEDCIKRGKQSTITKWAEEDRRLSATSLNNARLFAEAEDEYQSQLRATVDNGLMSRTESYDREEFEERKRPGSSSGIGTEQEMNLANVVAWTEAMRYSERVHGFSHPRTLECLSSLAAHCYDAGVLDTAESIMQRLLVSWEHCFGLRNRIVLYAVQCIAKIKMGQKRWTEASPYFSWAIELGLYLLADLEDVLGKQNDASTTPDDTETIQHLNQTIGKMRRTIAISRIHLAITYDMRERFSEAQALYSTVLQTHRDESDECRRLALWNQARQWEARGKYLKARTAYRELRNAYQHTPPKNLRDRRDVENKVKDLDAKLEKTTSDTSFFAQGLGFLDSFKLICKCLVLNYVLILPHYAYDL